MKVDYRSLSNSIDEAKKIYYQRKVINRLQQENQQLKEQIIILEDSLFDEYGNNRIDMMYGEIQIYIDVLDEIRDVLNNQMDYREFVDIVNKIEEILDKVKEL